MDERADERRDYAMIVKGVVDEDFVNYKVPSMYICTSRCSFKCDKECGRPVCQNSQLAKQKAIDIDDRKLIERYLNNPITNAIVLGGLEPFDQYKDIKRFLYLLRNAYECNDDVVIYTGYNMGEISNLLDDMISFGNIIIKYGRFVPDQQKHFDDVLGVYLASDNQYAERL